MSFDDLPRIRIRKWHRSSRGNRSIASARAEAAMMRNSGETVKIVKEVRWRIFWKRKTT